MTSPLPFALRRTLRRACLAGALASAALVAPSAQTPAAPPSAGPAPRPKAGQPPAPAGDTQQIPPVTFRAEIEYVEVDAVVTDERGNLVKGLSREDFDVYEDGKSSRSSRSSRRW